MLSRLKIEPLADHKDLIQTVAQWYLLAFGAQRSSLEKCENKLRTRLNTDRLDCCFLAFLDDKPIGTVTLAANDIPKCPQLTPCISHLFVLENYRHQALGRRLLEYAQQTLKFMHFNEAYLFTTDPTIHHWYKKLGWQVIGEDVFNDMPIKIMKCNL